MRRWPLLTWADLPHALLLLNPERSNVIPRSVERFMMIKAFKSAPKELFRINNGPSVRLRPQVTHRPTYDIHLSPRGTVLPKALQPSTYLAPNGASMRPNSPYLHRLLRFRMGRRDDAIVYILPKGTPLPEQLLLVHERADHWSMQPAKETTLDDLNESITDFFRRKCHVLSIPDWFLRYPIPTEPSTRR